MGLRGRLIGFLTTPSCQKPHPCAPSEVSPTGRRAAKSSDGSTGLSGDLDRKWVSGEDERWKSVVRYYSSSYGRTIPSEARNDRQQHTIIRTLEGKNFARGINQVSPRKGIQVEMAESERRRWERVTDSRGQVTSSMEGCEFLEALGGEHMPSSDRRGKSGVD